MEGVVVLVKGSGDVKMELMNVGRSYITYKLLEWLQIATKTFGRLCGAPVWK